MTSSIRLISESTLDAINEEAASAFKLHGPNSMLNRDLDNGKRLAILMEEVGEVATELTYEDLDLDQLERELTQVAAMAAAWIEAMHADS